MEKMGSESLGRVGGSGLKSLVMSVVPPGLETFIEASPSAKALGYHHAVPLGRLGRGWVHGGDRTAGKWVVHGGDRTAGTWVVHGGDRTAGAWVVHGGD